MATNTRKIIREFFRRAGRKGAKVRAQRLTPEERQAIARKAAEGRWAKERKPFEQLSQQGKWARLRREKQREQKGK